MMRLHRDSVAYYRGQIIKKNIKRLSLSPMMHDFWGFITSDNLGSIKPGDLKIRVWRKDRYNTRDLNILNILTDWCYSGHFPKSQPFFRAHTEVNVKNGVVKIFIGLKTSQNISKRSTWAWNWTLSNPC